MTELKTRYVGNCPVCERDQRLKDNRMVHHGYQRPGDGYIYGDCPGVKKLAYELSTEGCEYYLKAVQSQRVEAVAHLASLEGGEIKTLYKETFDPTSRFPKLVPVQEGEAGFPKLLQSAINKANNRLQRCDMEIARMEKRIAAWVEKPIRTHEEAAEAARLAPEKLARKAERQAKRDAKAAKAAALKAKYAAWEAEKQAIVVKYREIFTALAASVESNANTRASAVISWKEMYRAMNKRSALYSYPRELGCDEALVALGLARPAHSNMFWYADESGWLAR